MACTGGEFSGDFNNDYFAGYSGSLYDLYGCLGNCVRDLSVYEKRNKIYYSSIVCGVDGDLAIADFNDDFWVGDNIDTLATNTDEFIRKHPLERKKYTFSFANMIGDLNDIVCIRLYPNDLCMELASSGNQSLDLWISSGTQNQDYMFDITVQSNLGEIHNLKNKIKHRSV